MQQIDSLYQFDPKDWATYEAAHVQADAAIEAAKIGAKAAKDAADLQLDAAIIAALAAVIVGCLAYFASILAADRQTELERNKHKLKIKAYSVRQSIIIMELKEILSLEISEVMGIVKNYHCLSNKLYRNFIGLTICEEPSEWKDEKWEDPHIIGDEFANHLIITKFRLNSLRSSVEILRSFSEGEHEVYKGEYVFNIDEDNSSPKNSTTLHFLEKYEKELWESYKSLSNLYESLPVKFSGHIRNPDAFLGYIHNNDAY